MRNSIRNSCGTSILCSTIARWTSNAQRGIDGADKFDQHAVANGFDNPTAMRSNRSIDQGFAKRLQSG